MTHYFATVARGLETVAAQELITLGAQQVKPDFCGVYFEGDQRLLYQVNLWSRTIFRVLVPLRTFACCDAQQLYREVQRLDWREYVTPAQTLAVVCTGSNSQLNHTHFTALQVKNAIVDQQRHYSGERSSVNAEEPDILLNLHLEGDTAVLSLDSSGGSLHRRGYRPEVGLAPLKETLAAALLLMAGWQAQTPLLDPLCGSGTLPLEAGLQALDIAPGLFRRDFGFQHWLDFDSTLWEELFQEAHERELTTLAAPIWGSDQDADLIEQACHNAQRAGLSQQITFSTIDLHDLEAPTDQGVLICNPPYGQRLGSTAELGDFYRSLGDILKQRFKGWTAFVLTGNKDLAKQIGLRTAKRFAVYNGTIPCTLLKYELY